MVHRSMENLKLDKRLAGRRGFADPAQIEEARAALPDVADKAERVAVLPDTEEPSGEAAGRAGENPTESI